MTDSMDFSYTQLDNAAIPLWADEKIPHFGKNIGKISVNL